MKALLLQRWSAHRISCFWVTRVFPSRHCAEGAAPSVMLSCEQKGKTLTFITPQVAYI